MLCMYVLMYVEYVGVLCCVWMRVALCVYVVIRKSAMFCCLMLLYVGVYVCMCVCFIVYFVRIICYVCMQVSYVMSECYVTDA